MALAWPLSALCCLDVALLEWVIVRVCLRSLRSSIAAFAHKSASSPACLLGMPSVFKPLARERDC